jgi:hypothetical protein
MRSSIAVKNASDSLLRRLGDHRACVVFGIPRVDNDGFSRFVREGELLGERAPLLESRRIIVMVVEPAFADCNCAFIQERSEQRYVAQWIEPDGIVRMNTCRVPHVTGVRRRDEGGCASGAEDVVGAAP